MTMLDARCSMLDARCSMVLSPLCTMLCAHWHWYCGTHRSTVPAYNLDPVVSAYSFSLHIFYSRVKQTVGEVRCILRKRSASEWCWVAYCTPVLFRLCGTNQVLAPTPVCPSPQTSYTHPTPPHPKKTHTHLDTTHTYQLTHTHIHTHMHTRARTNRHTNAHARARTHDHLPFPPVGPEEFSYALPRIFPRPL